MTDSKGLERGGRVLILHNQKDFHDDLIKILEFMGEDALSMQTSEISVLNQTEKDRILAIFLVVEDINELLTELSIVNKSLGKLPIIVYSPMPLNQEDIDTQVNILGYIQNPIKYVALMSVLHRCQAYKEAMNCQTTNARPIELFRSLVGMSRAIQGVRDEIAQVAKTDVNVLITGESGTGKEVVARNIHYYSDRREKPFVPVNCGAIPADLLESELFGHEKGAFTGAISTRQGKFEQAAGGTLFLDEIGDMPHHMQVKLLRVLQEKTFERVGSNKTIEADVRVISATHCDLEQAIEDAKFREDLYFRLNVFPIHMPPLRERTEDIAFLLNDLISRIESEKRGSIRFEPSAITTLCQYQWPGNIRELANLVERMVVINPYGVVKVDDLPEKFRQHYHGSDRLESSSPVSQTELDFLGNPTAVLKANFQIPDEGVDLKEHLSQLEIAMINQALKQTNGVVVKAAEKLKMRRTTLVEKMKKYGLNRSDAVQ